MSRWNIIAGASFAAALALAAPASAQFYEHKTLTFLVNYAAGGTTDVEGRIFARHLGKHLKGGPTIVVVNKPGAGGLVGVNYLGSGAVKADGLMVCFCVLNVIAPIVGDPALKVKYDDFVYIGGAAQSMVAYGRRDIPPGITRPADIARAERVFAAGYNPSTPQDVRTNIALQLLGAKFRMVTGFRSANDAMKSVGQNETNFTSTTVPGFMTMVTPNLVANGAAMPYFYYPVTKPGGGFDRIALLEKQGVKSFGEVYREVFGKAPSGPKWEAMLLVNDLSTLMLRAMLLPKGSPQQAVTELRAGVAALGKDEAFLKDYQRVNALPPEMVSAEQGQDVLARLKTVKPEVVSVLKAVIGIK